MNYNEKKFSILVTKVLIFHDSIFSLTNLSQYDFLCPKYFSDFTPKLKLFYRCLWVDQV